MNAKIARLLIVSSAADEARLFTEYLRDEFELDFVERGAEALGCLDKETEIDLVLLAGSPPDIGILELVGAIRDRHLAGGLPLIMLESDGGPEEVARAFQNGADNCLMRPFSETALRARIEALLEVKRSFDRAQAKYAELEQSDMQRLQICRMASHDLQAPLNNIRLVVRGLQSGEWSGPGDVNRSLETIRLLAENMGDIMSNYLDVMELNSGQLGSHLKPVSLRDAIVNVSSQYELAASEKDIRLCIGSVEGWVMADAARLVQALGNLVSNALKYSPPGSTVQLATAGERGLRWLIVADEGPGIPPADRSRLFQEFGKLSTYPTGGESRTGLGLWIVKQLVEAQNGQVRADFPASGGSRFHIGFPTVDSLEGPDAQR